MTVPNTPPTYSTPLPPPYLFSETSTPAIISLIFGIISYLFLPLIGAIVAIVLGTIARREIAASNGRLTGQGLATAGLVLGWIQIALIIISVAFWIGLLVLLGAGISHSATGSMTMLLSAMPA